MNAFLCVLRCDVDCSFEVTTAQAGMRSLRAHYHTLTAVGDVRLDNRTQIAGMGLGDEPGRSDLDIALAAIARHGEQAIPELLGDFAFVIWDASACKLIAARDAFGVKPLFYRRAGSQLWLASRLEPLCGPEIVDRDYVAEFLAGMPRPSGRTIWQGTCELLPGTMLVQRGTVATHSRYWSAEAFQPAQSVNEVEVVTEFRRLFAAATAQRIEPDATWSQLSGGVDSSAVVCTAHWLHEQQGGAALNGTVSVVDSLGTGDESCFVEAVTRRTGLRNVTVRDYWPWRSDAGAPPPASDEPSPLFPFHARDQRMVDLVRQDGGRVLLSGLGSDHYLSGPLSYMADMLARGAVARCARAAFGWALLMRRSVWQVVRQHVLKPLLKSPRGGIFQAETALELARVSGWIQRGPFQDQLEVRYPFLSRPLVEFVLQLPIDMRIRPQGSKWILRQAMRGLLPEEVRTRAHKGGIDARILWALERERAIIDAMLKDSMLADLGCIDASALRATVAHARHGSVGNTVHVMSALALESWLRARRGEPSPSRSPSPWMKGAS